jgi:hypothetical protein
MADLNNIKKQITDLTNKAQSDLSNLLDAYGSMQEDVETRFRTEQREQGGRMDGLEDFYSLNLLVKRNLQTVSNTVGMLKRLRDISGFDISEITDLEYKKIKEIVT